MSGAADETLTVHYWTCPQCGAAVTIQMDVAGGTPLLPVMLSRLFGWELSAETLIACAPWVGEQAEDVVEEHEATHLAAAS